MRACRNCDGRCKKCNEHCGSCNRYCRNCNEATSLLYACGSSCGCTDCARLMFAGGLGNTLPNLCCSVSMETSASKTPLPFVPSGSAGFESLSPSCMRYLVTPDGTTGEPDGPVDCERALGVLVDRTELAREGESPSHAHMHISSRLQSR